MFRLASYAALGACSILSILAILATSAGAAPRCTAENGTRTCIFTVTKAFEEWTVPSHITSSYLAVEARAGGGGNGSNVEGGRGGLVGGKIAAGAGDTFTILVGEAGGDASDLVCECLPNGGEAGWPNGGASGDRFGAFGAVSAKSGGGGGMSVFGRRGQEDSINPFLVAGGGGGAGSTGSFGLRSGGVGADVGSKGGDGADAFVATGGKGGGAGATSAGLGGRGGGFCTDSPGGTSGQNGSSDRGGGGGYGLTGTVAVGGGGGGGAFGGGGGGAGGTCPSTAFGGHAGGGGGGGGSSGHDPNKVEAYQAAVSASRGNGQVKVQYLVADDVPPDTAIDDGPAASVDLRQATFSFSGTDDAVEPISGFECAIDAGQYEACASPKAYTGLAEGAHEFRVRARDGVGNADPEPATRTWTVDTSATYASCTSLAATTRCTFPRTNEVAYQTWVVPAGVTRATITADGAAGAQASGLGGRGGRAQARLPVTPGEIMRIYVGGTGNASNGIPFDCPGGGLNGGGAAGCNDLGSGGGGGGASDVRRSPFALADRVLVGGGGGGAGGAFDASGAVRAGGGAGGGEAGGDGGAADAGGGATATAGGAAGAWPTYCSFPTSAGNSFTASAGTLGAGGDGADCGSGGGGGGGGYYGGGGGGGGVTTPGSGGGGGGGSGFADSSAVTKSFQAGVNEGEGSVTIRYTTETDAPTVSVSAASGQADPASVEPIVFTAVFSEPVTGLKDDDVTVGGTAGATSATVDEVGPGDGTTYRITVSGVTSDGAVTVSLPAGAAEDEAGNPSEASQDSTVAYVNPDITPPSTEITSPPPSLTKSRSATLAFSGTDNGPGVVKFECRLDGADFASCDSPKPLTALVDGSHTFEVRAIDGAGNVDPTPASHTWTVDATPPVLNPVVSPSPLWLGAIGSALPGATDTPGSGIASASCGPVSTSTVGARTVTCTATDNAGNTTTVTKQYLVEYRLLGFFDPAPNSKWKVGQTVPIKVTAANFAGTPITDAQGAALASACRVTFVVTGAQTTTAPACMKYDAEVDRFVYGWKLAKSPTGVATIAVRIEYPPPASRLTVRAEDILITG